MKAASFGGLALAATLALTACSNDNGGLFGMDSSQTVGTGAGAAAGGAAGYLITGGPVGTVIGVGAGALIGNRLSNFLEGDAQAAAARAAELPTGEKVTWKKTDALFQTAGSGWAAATGAAFQDSGARTCRFVRESATKGDKTSEDTMKLCKGPTGWVPA